MYSIYSCFLSSLRKAFLIHKIHPISYIDPYIPSQCVFRALDPVQLGERHVICIKPCFKGFEESNDCSLLQCKLFWDTILSLPKC